MNKNLLFILLVGAFHSVEAGKTRRYTNFTVSIQQKKSASLDEILALVEEKKYQTALESLPHGRPRNLSMGAILKLALIQERLKQENGPRKLKRAVNNLLAKKDKALIKKLVQAVQDAKEWEILNILSEEEETNPHLFDEGFQVVTEEDVDGDDDWVDVTPVDEQ
jgi:hypothetical protein